MTLAELIKSNGGARPDQHWECLAFLGGCGGCWPTEAAAKADQAHARSCGWTPWRVQVFAASPRR